MQKSLNVAQRNVQIADAFARQFHEDIGNDSSEETKSSKQVMLEKALKNGDFDTRSSLGQRFSRALKSLKNRDV